MATLEQDMNKKPHVRDAEIEMENASQETKLDEAKQQQKPTSNTTPEEKISFWPLVFRSISVCLGAIYTGYALGSYSFVQDTMKYVLDNDESYVDGLSNGLVSLGIAVGGIWANFLVNGSLKKRRSFIFVTDLLGALACIIQCFPYIWCLFPARFLGGIACGFNFFICPVYIKEYIPGKFMGTCITIYSNCVVIGVMISYIVAFSLEWDPSKNVPVIWRLNLAFPIIFTVLRLILVGFVYKLDTPTSYLMHNDAENAKKAMLQTFGQENIENKFNGYKEHLNHQEETKLSFRAMFTKKYLKRLIMAIFSASSEAFTGLMIYTAYSWKIYQKITTQDWSVFFSVMQLAIQMIFTIFLGKLIQKYNRKTIMVTSLCVALIAQIGSTVASYMIEEEETDLYIWKFITVLCMQLYYACLGIGISSISFLVVLDLVPQAGMSCSNSGMAVFNAIYAFVFAILINNYAMWYTLLTLAVCDLFVIFVYKFWVIETKDITEEKLVQIFEKKNA